MNRRGFMLKAASGALVTGCALALEGGSLRVFANGNPPPVDIQWAKDLNKLEGLEIKHVPILELKSSGEKLDHVELHIQVGQILHAMTRDHHIEWISVYVDELEIYRASLKWPITQPRTLVYMKRMGPMKITVVERCNLHGVWGNRVAI